jgi:hypothetical protein
MVYKCKVNNEEFTLYEGQVLRYQRWSLHLIILIMPLIYLGSYSVSDINVIFVLPIATIYDYIYKFQNEFIYLSEYANSTLEDMDKSNTDEKIIL